MKALVLKSPNEFGTEQVPDPELGEGEILLRVKSCAICGTDIRILEGKKTRGVRYPSIIGHEIAGSNRGYTGFCREPYKRHTCLYSSGDSLPFLPLLPGGEGKCLPKSGCNRLRV